MTTTTPPKILETDLKLNLGKESDFQSMLEDFGSPKEASFGDELADPEPRSSSSVSQTAGKASRPPPINTDRSKEVEPSPYSWDSRHSEEGLLSTFDSGRRDSLAAQVSAMSISGGRKSVPRTTTPPPATTSHRALDRPRAGADKGLRRSVIYSEKRDSAPVEDEDARLIMQALYSGKGNTHETENEPLFGHANDTAADLHGPAPLRVRRSPALSEYNDPSIAHHARLAAQYENRVPKSTSPANKVMTPSQFEHYKQQQELRRANSDASKSEYSSESEFDEDDEAEKNREAERQRRKQEAHLSVYRQQMMKVTGQQQSSTPSLRPEPDHSSNSDPKLTVRSSIPGNPSTSGKSSDGGDDDEEIPLGILAAHGFPSKNRPPTRLSTPRSIPNLRSSFQLPRSSASSAHGDQGTANHASLPAFAKNLPRDPYYGASIVNPTNRESLALGGGMSAQANPSPSALPPGGLVGVIATEERARANRRGSPNTQAMYEHAALGGSTPHLAGGIPRPYSMMGINPPSAPSPQPPVSATEQAQIQLSQQMSQMMQLQMQWMQQMMQMQGGQSSLQPPPQMRMAGSLPSINVNSNGRPASMPAAEPLNPATTGSQGGQRALSMLNPQSSRVNTGPPMSYATGGLRPGTPAGQGYAPSIAPSERSNIGAGPRYRPMSAVQPEQGPSLVPPMSKPWNDENQRSSISLVKPSAPSVTVRPVSSAGFSVSASKPRQAAAAAADDDDDDDEGWAEMMKKRENKKSNWKTKRETSNLGDLLNVVH